MKRNFLTILAVAFIFGLTTIFSACGGSDAKDGEGDDAVKEVKEVVKEKVEAVKDTVKVTADYTKGAAIYAAKCAACHNAEGIGAGETFPALKGNTKLEDKTATIKTIVNGVKGTAMVAFTMEDQEITDLVNYINNSWDNKYGEITAEDVATAKK